MTGNESSTNKAWMAPARGRLWFALLLAASIAAALTLYGIQPVRTPTSGTTAQGGCDHTPGPNGPSACPHGVNASGGCNMSEPGTDLVASGPQTRLSWTLPRGWTASLEDGGLRYATLKPTVVGDVEVSVSFLPGGAGGAWANLNRWRGQVGLQPISESEVESHRAWMKSKAGQIAVFDIDNPDSPKGRMTVGMVEGGTHTWFLKVTGTRRAVLRARPAFLDLLGSLRAEDHSSPERFAG